MHAGTSAGVPASCIGAGRGGGVLHSAAAAAEFRMTEPKNMGVRNTKAALADGPWRPMGCYFLGVVGAGLAGVIGFEVEEAGLAAGAAGGGTPESRL